ncbi:MULTISPECIES: nucleopolyhedrovirus P10 family protein [Streptomyces]|uniref:nucleopolyhedrovirus P10 family protein n=1 Tax=Streptomyces TaxID=1883 RepID=UPI001E4C361F|nr:MULTISPECIES: nucleopolyhedrovirus P10 family protein [Streptomyces]UFQ14877.1 nucleopolyhedrovirus P10 family protein [Streptomyces huasconensis]WCL84481.1 nucleopolyhedrovirus P10 family protein [Streptomyces sp. JCM 35825]
MTGDGLTEAVRHRLGLGRVLPLGGARDGTWVTEAAVDGVLRHAAQRITGVRLGGLRVALADPDAACAPAVPPPPSALPPGPLRITADFAAATGLPLPAAADRLRAALGEAAQRLGLVVAEVDLRVTALLDEGSDLTDGRQEAPRPPAAQPPAGDGEEARAGQAALAVPGVTRLTGALGPAVHIKEHPARDGALPRRHARVELATGREHRALDVALAVRAAVGEALPDHPSVAVLVTAVD